MRDEAPHHASSGLPNGKRIESGSVTPHTGVPHGPHTGRAEAAIRLAGTGEVAIMLDTSCPRRTRAAAVRVEDEERSWIE